MGRGRSWFGWFALAVVAAGWAVLLRPPALGGDATYVVVRGTSMLPAYRPGDLLIVRAGGGPYRAGEVIAFTPDGPGTVVVHRVVGTGAGRYRTQGDNGDPDPWLPADADVVGSPFLRIPRVGQTLARLADPLPLAAACALVTLAAVAAPVRRARSA